MYNSVLVEVYRIVQSLQPSNFRTFPSTQKETSAISSHFLFFAQLLATINLLSVFLDLPVLDISYECSYVICSLLCLASFSIKFGERNGFNSVTFFCSLNLKTISAFVL